MKRLKRGINTWRRNRYDGPLVHTLVHQSHENKLYAGLHQPSRAKIMEHVKRLQLEPEALKPEPDLLGQVIIPLADYKRIMRGNPELQASDRETRARAWAAFLRNEGAAYRVR